MTDLQRIFIHSADKDKDIDYDSITKGNRRRADRFTREFNELYDLFDNGNDRFMKAVHEHMSAC